MRVTERMLNGKNCKRRQATADTKRKVEGWDVWECNDETFQHDYDRTVTMYVDRGNAVLIFADGEVVDITAGETLTVQAGASASWQINAPIRNLYCYHDSFGSAANRSAQVKWQEKQD